MSLNDLEKIDPITLPSMPLERATHFPAIPAIYFVLDMQDVVRYVGQTGNLKKRWHPSSPNGPNARIPGSRIAYVCVDNAKDRRILERRLIRRFQPSNNRQGTRRDTPHRSLALQISQDLYEAIDLLSDASGRTVFQEAILLLHEAVIARQ